MKYKVTEREVFLSYVLDDATSYFDEVEDRGEAEKQHPYDHVIDFYTQAASRLEFLKRSGGGFVKSEEAS